MISSESKYTPRLRADAAGVMSWPPVRIMHVDRKLVLPAWRGEPEELGLVGIELLAVRLHPGGDVIEALAMTTNELLRISSPARAVDLRVVGVQMLCNYFLK